MSLLGKEWVLKALDIEELLHATLDDETVMFHDPFLMKDMEKSVARIREAIDAQEKIVIFGDYDVDGISGTAILVQALRALGAKVSYRLPDRQSGYGLNMNWIEEFKKIEVDVLITVDCGISNREEVRVAAEAGIDVIVTDHHTVPSQVPDRAIAILHPNLPGDPYPFHHLAGAAVAFKLAVALFQRLRSEEDALVWRQKLVDLASLGTVADCMPLSGENRWIAKQGIDQLRNTEWEGLRTLLQIAGVDHIQGYDSDIIGFRIGPRLNASGRLDTPYYALQLLLNENGKAAQFAQKLEEMNNERKILLETSLASAEEQLRKNGGLDKKILIGWSSTWPAGIIGLIAGRLAEKYHRPTIIMEHRDTHLVASCRSIEGFHIVEALNHARDHLKTYGGHSAAAGFTLEVEKLPAFLESVEEYVEASLSEEAIAAKLSIDYHIQADQVTAELADRLETRAPYGEGNRKPRFLLKDMQTMNLQVVGKDRQHLKLNLLREGVPLSVIAFRFGPHYEKLVEAERNKQSIDVVFELNKNRWNGKESLELFGIDFQINGAE